MKVLAALLVVGVARPAIAQSDGGAGPLFGPELDVDTPVLTGAVGDQSVSAGAWDGQRLLAAWRTPLWQSELRVARVSAAGEVLDPRGIRLDGFERSQGTIAVAAGSGGFLVAWSQDPNLVQVARVSTDGQAEPSVTVDRGPIDVRSWGPAVAAAGDGFWVVWSRNGSAAGVYAARVGGDGRPRDATPLRLDPGSAEVAIAADGAGHALAAWTSAEGSPVTRAARLDGEGRLLDATPPTVLVLPAETAGPLSVAAGGGTFLVTAASLHLPGETAALRAARVSADGRVLDSGAGLALGTSDGPLAGGPTAAWNGSGFAVLWASQSVDAGKQVFHLAGRTVTDGALAPLAPATAGRMPVLVPADADPWLLWSQLETWADDGSPADADIRARRLAASGASTLVTLGVNDEAEPVVAWSGRRLLVVWEDRRDDRAGGDIYAGRADDASGAGLDGSGIAVATGPAPQHTPAVAWDGESFLVAWHEEGRGLGTARLGPEGEVLDRTPRFVPGTADQDQLSNPVVCADGDGVLLVWAAQRGATGEVRGLRLPRGATVGEVASFPLAAAFAKDLPAVMRMACNERAAVLAFTANLAPSDEVPLYLGHLARGATAFTAPGPRVLERKEGDEWAGVGTDGQDFLVAWRNFDASSRRRVVVVRVAADGRLLDEVAHPIGRSNSGRRVNAWWDGSEYVVLAINTMADDPFALRGHRVTRELAVLEPDWFTVTPVARQVGDTGTGSDAVYLGGQRSYLVYDRFFDPDATGNTRVRGRFLSPAPPPPDGSADGGEDGSADAGTVAPEGGGCGCRVGGRGPATAPLALLALLAFPLSGRAARSRRARRSRQGRRSRRA
jgi:hypothetical protein